MRSVVERYGLRSLWLATAVALALPAACTAAGAPPTIVEPAQARGREPVSPAVLLDTRIGPTTGRKIKVEPDDQSEAPGALQAALDAAQPGDVIELRPGGIYTGNFVLPAKAGAEWIVIRPWSNAGHLPDEGTRVTPTDAERMPKILTPGATPAIAAAAGAHHFRFVGIELGLAPGVAANNGIVIFGSGAATALSEVPHNLILDRCYVHGSPAADVQRGVVVNSARTAIVDSTVSDIHAAGIDSQAIVGWAGPGPFKIVNNYLEASGENVMFGGADPRITNLVPSDIEIRQNHFVKPLSWRPGDAAFAGRTWSVKNLFELKNARRVLVEGNLFENNWPGSQSGVAILFTVRNQDGTAPWSVVEDVSFTGNTVRRAAAALNLLGRDDANQSARSHRIAIRNNLFDEVGPAGWGTNGRFLIISDAVDVTVDHNTIVHTGNIVTAHGAASPGFVFTNNLARHNDYGIIGDNAGVGVKTLTIYFPDAAVQRNALVGGKASDYPDGNLFPESLEAAGLVVGAGGNYRLTDASPARGAGLDGKDIGCDLRAVKRAERIARAGTPGGVSE